MKSSAFDKAEYLLDETNKHYHTVCSANTYTQKDFLAAWTAFLISGNLVLTTLMAGADSDKEENWGADKIKAIQSDMLLTYMREARNDHEHGIEFIAKAEGGGPPHHDMTAILPGGGQMRIMSLHPATYTLKDAVNNKTGKVFPVPTKHLGKDVHPHPSVIGHHWYNWLKATLSEAVKDFPRT